MILVGLTWCNVTQVRPMSASPEGPSPLEQCCACVVADTDAQRLTLERIARRTGFVRIGAVFNRLEAPASRAAPVPFFFFHYRLSEERLRSAMSELRSFVDENRRFSPAIIVVGECSYPEVVQFVNLGFDDIVVLPEAAAVLQKRFVAQLDAQITYFETGTYLGPDRRRLRREPRPEFDRPSQKSRHVRYLINRSARAGIRLLRREVIFSPGPGAGAISPALDLQ
jgi:hypothetical protein